VQRAEPRGASSKMRPPGEAEDQTRHDHEHDVEADPESESAGEGFHSHSSPPKSRLSLAALRMRDSVRVISRRSVLLSA
jgi:hypothetical protein